MHRSDCKGRYQIIKKLGEGGMGAVYLAEQISMARKVALKVLQGNFANDDEFIGRFRREARLAASLNHPYIVTVHDFDQADPALEKEPECRQRDMREVVHGLTRVGRTMVQDASLAETMLVYSCNEGGIPSFL